MLTTKLSESAVSFASYSFVQVIVPRAIPTVLDYRWADNTPPQPGMFVHVPVGTKHITGVVTEVMAQSAFQNLKNATPHPTAPPLKPQMLAFLRWAARYNLCPPGEPLRALLVKSDVPSPPRKIPTDDLPATPQLLALNAAQQTALTHIRNYQNTQPILLDGVTGSGKTEVYFHLIAEHLAAQPAAQILVLLPEISLVPQWLKRFQAQFQFTPTAWHANLTPAQRKQAWWDIAQNRARVIVGARSALFVPFQQLSLIIVDEEHDGSYKQEDGFRYHGRDMAVVLAKIWDIPVILSSATPSLETWHNVQKGKYHKVNLPSRHGQHNLPDVHLIDLRENKPAKDQFLSPLLLEKLTETYQRGEQSLVFLNRRGNAPLLLCTACGYRRDCPRCDATVTVHGDRLICHYCGYTEAWPETCPQCHAENSWRLFGPGTRRLIEEIQNHLPTARWAVADSDAIQTTQQQKALIEQILNQDIDILIGTQMMAKGHHFPHLTLVGVVDGDMGLTHGDLRAAEKTFQLITQVAGRAGRAAAPGHVYIQTHQPEQPLFKALQQHNRAAFYAEELRTREDWQDPPFTRMIALILQGKHEKDVQYAGRVLVQNAPTSKDVVILGPAPAPISKIRDNHRYRILIKGQRNLQKDIKNWLENTATPPNVRIIIDVEPQSFF